MSVILPVGFLAVGLLAFYIVVIRPVLRSFHFFDAITKQEKTYWEALSGFRQMIVAWFLIIASAMVGIYDFVTPFVAGQNWAPVVQLLPSWAWPFIWLAIGVLFAYLRKITTTPPASAAPIIGSIDPAGPRPN